MVQLSEAKPWDIARFIFSLGKNSPANYSRFYSTETLKYLILNILFLLSRVFQCEKMTTHDILN